LPAWPELSPLANRIIDHHRTIEFSTTASWRPITGFRPYQHFDLNEGIAFFLQALRFWAASRSTAKDARSAEAGSGTTMTAAERDEN
jgi:hypothetical protein